MFRFILSIFFLTLRPSSTKNPQPPRAVDPPDFSATIHQDKINNLLVCLYDCRGRLNLQHFSPNRVVDCNENPYGAANNKARVNLSNRAKAKTITGYQR